MRSMYFQGSFTAPYMCLHICLEHSVQIDNNKNNNNQQKTTTKNSLEITSTSPHFSVYVTGTFISLNFMFLPFYHQHQLWSMHICIDFYEHKYLLRSWFLYAFFIFVKSHAIRSMYLYTVLTLVYVPWPLPTKLNTSQPFKCYE